MGNNDSSVKEQATRALRGHRDPPLRIDDAALALALSEKTLRDWIAQRRLAIIRLGRAIRVPQSEVDRLLEEGTVPARRAGK
jgi:excisionase family DNA binding protein